MLPVAFHVVFRLRNSIVIARNRAQRRSIARRILRIGERFGLLSFRISGDHLHAQVACTREEAGAFAQAVGSSITQALGLPVGFGRAFLTPIDDSRHLTRTFHYILGNATRHGLTDDLLHDGSALPDLLGMRVLPTRIVTRVRTLLPRTTRESLLEHLGVGRLDEELVPLHLADAAAAAVGFAAIGTRVPEVRLARAAAVHVARGTLEAAAIADLLGVAPRSLRRLNGVEVSPALRRAVRLQMSFRAALGERLFAGHEPDFPLRSPESSVVAFG